MYFYRGEININESPDTSIENRYGEGFVFTRKAKGNMQQTRSIRIDLSKFSLSSENKRILKKTETIQLSETPLPLQNYDWKIGKLAKDFYDTKFGEGTFSANKIKELLTDTSNSNFNLLLSFDTEHKTTGYAICFSLQNILHYSYPFYDLLESPKDMGLGMMTKAVLFAKETGKKYIYLGSAQRKNDTYKLQFEGLEWFDGSAWQTNTDDLKHLLQTL